MPLFVFFFWLGLLGTPAVFWAQKSTLLQAEQAFELGQFQRAHHGYSKVIRQRKLLYYAYFKRAYCSFRLQHYALALEDIKIALQIPAKDPVYKFVRGNTFWLKGRVYGQQGIARKAIRAYRKAQRYLRSSSSMLFNNIGYQQMQLKTYRAALKSLNKALAINPQNAYSYSNRAYVYLQLEQMELGLADAQKAIALDKLNPYAFYHKGLLHLSLEQLDDACLAFAKAQEKNNLSWDRLGKLQRHLEMLQQIHCDNYSKFKT